MTSLSAINPADQAISTTANQFGKMKTEDFIRIIFTELSNQDPFQPNDSKALLDQLNSIRSIESDIKLMDQLQSLVAQNQLAAGSNMMGKFVAGLSVDNFRVAGYVVAVIRQGDQVSLELDNGWIVPMSGVEQVIDPALLDDPNPNQNPNQNPNPDPDPNPDPSDS